MLIAEIHGHTVLPGTVIEIPGIDKFKFTVLEICRAHFEVEWLVGEQKGKKDRVPYTLFPSDSVKVSDITDDTEPNQAFKMRKLLDV